MGTVKLAVGRLAGCDSAVYDGLKRGRQVEGIVRPSHTRWTSSERSGCLLGWATYRLEGGILARRRGYRIALKEIVFIRRAVARRHYDPNCRQVKCGEELN